MKLTFQAFTSRVPTTHLLALPFCEGEKPRLPQGIALAKVGLADLKGEWKETRVADATGGPARRVLFYGLGKKSALDVEKVRRFGAVAVQRAEALGAKSAAILAPQWLSDALGAERTGQALAEGARLGAYRFEEGLRRECCGLAANVIAETFTSALAKRMASRSERSEF